MLTVSESALIRRVNRRLAHDEEQLHKARGQREAFDLGEFWVRDWRTNGVVMTNVDLEGLAREMGALAPGERLL